MHKNLTRERPFYAPHRVPCSEKILKVECYNGIVWAVTKDRHLLVRTGVCKGKEEAVVGRVGRERQVGGGREVEEGEGRRQKEEGRTNEIRSSQVGKD